MTAKAFIKHESPGRLRVSFPKRAYDEEFFESLEQVLSEKFPQLSTKSNPVTGSLLLQISDEHDTSLRHLMELATQEGLLELIDAELSERPAVDLHLLLRRSIRLLDRLIRDFSKGQLDFKSVAGMSLLGLGFYQVRAGKVLPAALTLFLNAFAFLETSKSGRRA